MSLWEYTVLVLPAKTKSEDMEATLNEWGAGGWELVSVDSNSFGELTSKLRVFFKRMKSS